ncbi:dihydropyrimidinase [Desulfopila aestuarii]|uniref:Dihydropyrimidinase n=1 Tax=Desulfopila aestuarii DSM 18488 TaxID=1121416 RepID=A0A1M7XWD3_9BACT|nr:dihydropyrimidinase [Desulfopila aestuarii]SHO43058.1 dihydropyrimidinase [Desulfopila aestuarii DSM 18488]
MGSLLIKNGEIVSPLDCTFQDIYIEDGKIAALGKDLDVSADRVLDAAGQYVLPGGIDVHTHLDMPFMGEVSADDFESGTAAAMAGGTTSIIDYIVPGKGQSLLEALATWKSKAKTAVADYGFHMAVTWYSDQVAREMAVCVREEGIPSFKAFLAYKDAIMVNDEELVGLLKCSRELNALIMAHCENGEIVAELQEKLFAEGKVEPKYHALSRPSYAEGESAFRLASLARAIGVPAYFVHMSCAESTRVLVEARAQGMDIYGETCPQYLLLDDSVYDKPDFLGAAYVMSPPIRPKGHAESLWGAIRAGQIQVVGTDHCPFNLKGQKELGRDDFRKIPNGAAGIEDRLKLLYTYGVMKGRITINQMVAITSTNPAKIFGMYPQKGSITVGADADLVIWQPDGEGTISAMTHYHRVDTSIFEGYRTVGAPAVVIANGRVQCEDGKLMVEPGAGRFIPRKLTV